MPMNNSDRWHNTTVNPLNSIATTAQLRLEPQDEALSYDNVILLDVQSLRDTEHIAINLDQALREHIKNNEADEADESVI